MNSAENISKYGNYNNNHYVPITATNHDVTKSPKKEKKWSFGNIFRRKKKNDSDSSSENENKKKKKPTKLKTKSNNLIGFDHILIPTNSTNGYSGKNIFSEPDYKTKQNFIPASEIIHPSRKCKREGVKARAEARFRDSSRGENSSDDDSPFKSDESLSSSNRRSRAARTQRYLRRHSKDSEAQITTSDELWKPCANFSGLSTIPPSHRAVTSNKASSFCDYDMKNKLSKLNNRRSISYDGNIHHTPRTPSSESMVIHAQLPLGFPRNVSLNRIRGPPPPPPRDPNRVISVQNGDSRPISYCFDQKTSSDQYVYKLNPRITSYRSTSEDQLSGPPQDTLLVPRPSSTTPKSNDYRYLTDKNPRSRKPICVMQPNSFDFWRKKEERETSKSPVMFTAKTQVTTSIFTQPDYCKVSSPIATQSTKHCRTTYLDNIMPQDDNQRGQPSPFKVAENEESKSSNLEEALDELEAIYKSLHLGDEELLDRAAEREEALEQNLRAKIKSEPDPKADDMAYRKFRRDRHNTIADPVSPGSYLLTSPVFGGTINEFNKSSSNKEPDVTLDDVVYRNVTHTNNSLKITEPQPPFGIPVGPVLPSANSDYLHAASYNYQKSKKLPDIVKDDLAYRNLRKDSNKEPALPQAHLSREDYLNNNNFKKKRAVRSLSANIFNLMHQNQKSNVFEDPDPDQNIEDVADALQIARQILKEKEDKINATRKAFLSDGELKYTKFGSPKANKHKHEVDNNERLRVDTKPPKSSKATTPVPSNSPREDIELEKALQHSTLEELLTSLARETSDHITYELNTYDDPVLGLQTVNLEKSCEKLPPINCERPVIETTTSLIIAPEDTEEEHDYVNIQSTDENELTKAETHNVNADTIEDANSIISTNLNVGYEDPGKIIGEECVIALPTNGCTYLNKASFKFDCFNQNPAEDLTDANQSVFNELTSSFTQIIKSSLNIELDSQGEGISLTDNCVANSFKCRNVGDIERNVDLLSIESSTSNKVGEINNSCLTLEDMNLDGTSKIVNTECQNLGNVGDSKLGFLRSEQRAISHIGADFDSLQSPKLVQNLNCCNRNSGNVDKSNGNAVSDPTITSRSWYDDPSVIALACSCGLACSYQLPFDIIAALGVLFAVLSLLLAVITRIY